MAAFGTKPSASKKPRHARRGWSGCHRHAFSHEDATSKEIQTRRFAIENGNLFDSVSGTNTLRGVRDTGYAIRFRPDEKYFDTVKMVADFA